MKSEHKQARAMKRERQEFDVVVRPDEIDAAEIKRQMSIERERNHAKKHPDGCPDWCEDCQRRLTCKTNTHEWPRSYSDGDSCFCGAFQLFANSVDARPAVVAFSKKVLIR